VFVSALTWLVIVVAGVAGTVAGGLFVWFLSWFRRLLGLPGLGQVVPSFVEKGRRKSATEQWVAAPKGRRRTS
jgi:hypothetical protein